jgi:hypothetical protein
VDARIVHDVETGTATYTNGGNGSTNGLIDTQAAVGGWPELYSSDAPVDSDHDGMPDFWEDANGLNKNDPGDALLTNVDGKYPNIEVYINSLVAGITVAQMEDAIVSGSKRIFIPEQEPVVTYESYSGKINISHNHRIQLVQVYTVTGSLIISVPVKEYSAEFYVREKGILLVRITDENQKGFRKKIAAF